MDTIFATATARGKSGVAVIRLSGPLATEAAETLCGPLPPVRRLGLRRLVAPDGDRLDDAMVVWFAAGASFTGEAVVEFHLHGSVAVVAAVSRVLAGIGGLRFAEPGEFTRRALENGRLDLTQVEGLADLVDAETEAQRKQALGVLEGALADKVAAWRRDLVRAAALAAAMIDFSDEDLPEALLREAGALVKRVRQSIEAEVSGGRISERIRDGFEVAIVGPPNIGKSTLLNRLAGREAAITSEVAGTTRDVIEVRMDLGGLPVTLLDTAGLRDAEDSVEKEGVARAIARAGSADLRVFLIEYGAKPTGPAKQPGDVEALGKSDLHNKNKMLRVSGKTGEGVDELIARIERELESRAAGAGTAVRLRQRMAMERAVERLDSAHAEIMSPQGEAEIFAEEVNLGIRALDSLIGKVDVEDLLDEIFASFCLGK